MRTYAITRPSLHGIDDGFRYGSPVIDVAMKVREEFVRGNRWLGGTERQCTGGETCRFQFAIGIGISIWRRIWTYRSGVFPIAQCYVTRSLDDMVILPKIRGRFVDPCG